MSAALGATMHTTTMHSGIAFVNGDYEAVIALDEDSEPVDLFEESILMMLRMEAERALGRLDDAYETSRRFATLPTGFLDRFAGHWVSMTHLQRGDVDEAIAQYHFTRRRAPVVNAVAAAVTMLASAHRGEHAEATVMSGAFARWSEATGLVLPPGDMAWIARVEGELRETLGAEPYDELRAEGAALDQEQLVARLPWSQ